MITQKELADELGISVATVSLALSNSPLVNRETAKQILELARKRGYRRNNLGRALQEGHNRIIGCVLNTLVHSFFSEVIEGIGRTCAVRGYGFMVSWGRESSEQYVEQMLDNRVAGVIFAGYSQQFRAAAEYLRQLEISSFFCSTHEANDFPHVVTDDAAGGRMSLEYLYRCGHRDFLLENYHSIRVEAAQSFLTQHPDCTARFFSSAQEALKLYKLKQASAAVCFADESAVRLLGVFRAAGVSVPDDISVIGYDNIQLCNFPGIELTTVAQQREMLGVKCAEMAIACAENTPYPYSVMLEPHLVERKTVKKI
jgi:DNA-binding LacI/PurR family transcriptional regulator